MKNRLLFVAFIAVALNACTKHSEEITKITKSSSYSSIQNIAYKSPPRTITIDGMVYDSAAIMREMQIFSSYSTGGGLETATHTGDGPYNDSKNFAIDWVCCRSDISLLFGYFEISSHEAATIKQLYDYKTKRNSYIFYSFKHTGITLSKDNTRNVKVTVKDVYGSNTPINIGTGASSATVNVRFNIKKEFSSIFNIFHFVANDGIENNAQLTTSAERVVSDAGGYN